MANQNSFELEVIKPTQNFKVDIEWLDAQSPTGNFVVGPNHIPLISILKERGIITFKKVANGKEEKIDVYGGILKIIDNKATVILEL